jgi:hypothetical protein
MLTQTQKNKLEPLTKHEKFGKLLIDAMKTWEFIHPKQREFGVFRGKDSKWEADFETGCCLIGAAITGKDSLNDRFGTVMQSFSIDQKDMWRLSDGFDDHSNNESEAWLFGKTVSDIVFEKEGT